MQTVSFREGKPTKFLRDSDGVFFPHPIFSTKVYFFVKKLLVEVVFPQVSWEQTTPQKKLRCISNFQSTNSLQHLPYPKNHEISSHWLFGDVWRSQTPAIHVQTPLVSQGYPWFLRPTTESTPRHVLQAKSFCDDTLGTEITHINGRKSMTFTGGCNIYNPSYLGLCHL